jgi:60S ribosome subunit biogenesis protein NIP7
MTPVRLRKPNKKEMGIIKQALRIYANEVDFNLLVKDGIRKEVYAISDDLLGFINKAKLNIVCAGIKVGEVGKRFRFSLEGTFYLANKKRKRIYVNNKGEMLFLYGRDILAESVVDVTDDVRENDMVMVCNARDDIIGIGRSEFDASRIREVEKRVVVENFVDRGEYLRKRKLYDAY